MPYLILAIIIAIIAIAIASSKKKRQNVQSYSDVEVAPDEKEYGLQGELFATDIICSVLQDGDYFFRNVHIVYNGKKAELDNLIVNKYGVFIIEVKNFKGVILGEEDDYKWIKYKDDGYGNIFQKEVTNPIKQVKRQTYILANYLRENGVNVWVEGYGALLQDNSPVNSEHLLYDVDDIDRAIHTYSRKLLDAKTIEKIKALILN